MAAHLYWRVQINAVGGPSAVYVALPEIQMRDAIGGAQKCTGGTASASTTQSTNTPANAVDGNLSSIWRANAAPVQWWQYQFPVAVDIVEIAISTGTGPTGYQEAPTNFDLQWSDDGTSWTTAASFTGIGVWPSNETRIFRVGETTPVMRVTQEFAEVLLSRQEPVLVTQTFAEIIVSLGGAPVLSDRRRPLIIAG